MTSSINFTFFTSNNDTQEQQQSKQQFLSTEDQYIKLLNLIDTELGTKNEVVLRDWLSAIKVLGQIHSAFYKKLDTVSQDNGVVDTMINWGNTLEKPYLDYIKSYDQAQSQHQALLCASIKSIIKNISPTSPYYSIEGLLAAPLDQLELYKSIYLTLLDTSDSSKQLPLNNIIQNIGSILEQAPPQMVDSTSATDLLSFQNFVDCGNVIDLFTGSSLDYQLRPRQGKIVLQDDFLLLGDSEDQPALRVHMVLTSDILMICKQMADSTGRYDLLYPPLAVNDILVKPSMMDRELIGEYTLELTVLSKTLVLRGESREVRNAWTGMPLTATPKDAMTTNIPLKNVACSALSIGNGMNNNSPISLTFAQNGKSDLGSFYGNHDISPVESSEDDDDSDEDNDSHATTVSTSNSDHHQHALMVNKKSLPSLPAQPQPPKKDDVLPPPKDITTPMINVSLHDDKSNTATQSSSNRPLTPRGSSIRAPLPNPAFGPNMSSSSSPSPEMKPLPRTSSIRHRQQNGVRPENARPQQPSTMTMQRPHQQQAPPHQLHHAQQRPPPPHQHQHHHPAQSTTDMRPQPPPQQTHGSPMMMTSPQPRFSARPPNGPHSHMQHRPPPPHHHQQPQPRPPHHHYSPESQQRPPHPSQPNHHPLPQQQQQQHTLPPPTHNTSKPMPHHPGMAPTTVTERSEPATATQRPMPPTPPPQHSQFSTPSSSSSEGSSSQSHLPLTPGSRDSFGSSLRLSPEDLATPPRSPNPYSAQQNSQNGIRQVLFRSQQCEVFRWNDESWYAVEGQCILEIRQTFTNRSCIAIRVQTTGELYLNAWVLPQTQIRMESPTDVSLGVILGAQQETYLVHFGEPSEASELNQVLQEMHHAAVVAARQPNDGQRTLRGEPPTEMMMAAMQLDGDYDDDDDENQANDMSMDTTTGTTVGRTMTRSSSLMQSGKEPTLIPQTLEPAMQCKCKLFVQNEHSNWSSFGSVQLIVSLQVPSRRMHIQIEHEKKRGLSKIIPTVNSNSNSSNSPSPPSPSSSSSSSLPGTENGNTSPTTANTLISATVYSNNVTRLASKRISFLLVNERERTSSMVYMVQLKNEESGKTLYDYLKIKNAQNGW